MKTTRGSAGHKPEGEAGKMGALYSQVSVSLVQKFPRMHGVDELIMLLWMIMKSCFPGLNIVRFFR